MLNIGKNLLGILVVITLIGVSGVGNARDKGVKDRLKKDEESTKVQRDCASYDKDSKDRGLKKSRGLKDGAPSAKGAVANVVTDGDSDDCDDDKRIGKDDDDRKEKGSVKNRAAKKAGKAAVTGIAIKKAKDAIKD